MVPDHALSGRTFLPQRRSLVTFAARPGKRAYGLGCGLAGQGNGAPPCGWPLLRNCGNVGQSETGRGDQNMANEGPSLTKATYDKKRSRKPAPSPARIQAELEDNMRVAARRKQFAQHVTKVGLAHALFPDKVPPKNSGTRR
jgi:hypothetical protein